MQSYEKNPEKCKEIPKKILNKTFSNMEKTKKPRGYNEYVKRNRYVIEKKASDKKMEEEY